MGAGAGTGHRFGNENFPIIHDNGRLQVYTNHAGEIFVEDKGSGAIMRINPYGNGQGIRFSAAGGRVEPIVVNGMIQWRVSPP